MSAYIKHASRLREATADGFSQSFTYQGTQEEMLDIYNSSEIGVWYSEFGGKLTSRRIQQEEGPIWNCELSFASSPDGDYSDGPDYSYGRKSAQLRAGLLQLDLCMAPKYRTNWNYALYCAPGMGRPKWWSTAKTTELSDADAQNYIWAKVGEEHSDKRGKWRCIPPTKPGVESLDYPTYVVVESVRCATDKKAGNITKDMLNKIDSPDNHFGLGGKWKCDDVGVSWTGEYWLATLTWTRGQWDGDLYES
jgi:hypothetical protein